MISLVALFFSGLEDIQKDFKLIIEDIKTLYEDIISFRDGFSIVGIIFWLVKVESDLFTIMLRFFEPVLSALALFWNLFLWLVEKIKKKRLQ